MKEALEIDFEREIEIRIGFERPNMNRLGLKWVNVLGDNFPVLRHMP